MKINKLFDYEDFSDEEFLATQKEFWEAGDHRKSWEFTIMSYGLQKLGCFSGTGVALGTGCLKESLIYLYAERMKHTYATDVAYWTKDDSRTVLWGGEGYCVDDVYNTNIPYDRSKLTVLPMDMRKLEFPDEMFDVIWSSSSVEHTGGLDNVLESIREAERVLKLGGIFTITTEWNLTGGDAIKFANVQSFDWYVMGKIEEVTPRLKLVEPLDLFQSDHPKNKEKEYMLGKTNRFYGGPIDYTSMSIFWRKE